MSKGLSSKQAEMLKMIARNGLTRVADLKALYPCPRNCLRALKSVMKYEPDLWMKYGEEAGNPVMVFLSSKDMRPKGWISGRKK